MTVYDFKKNWWIAFILPSILIPVWVLAAYVCLKEIQKPDAQLSLETASVILALGVIAIGFLTYIPICQLLTTFNSEGITRNYLFWRKFVEWEAIEEAGWIPNNQFSRMIHLKLSGNKRDFQINTAFYQDPESLIKLLDHKISKP